MVWLIWVFPVIAISQIISPQKFFGGYQQFVWQDQHGLPQNGISEVVQTPDGYLWLAIAEGVVRFDGVRFTAFNTENTPDIKSNNVQSLLVDRSGTLWIGTHGGGLSRYKDGQFSHFSTSDGLSVLFVRCLFEDSSKNLWIGTDGGGLNLFKDGKFTIYKTADGLPDDYINTISEDTEGNLLVGTGRGLVQFRNGRFSVFTEKNGLAESHIDKIFRDRVGNIWVGGQNGLSRLSNRQITTFGISDGFKNNRIQSFAQDREDTLWIGTNEAGLYRFKDGRFEASNTNEGLISNDIQAIFADQTGDLWLGTNGGGLAQLRTGQFRTYTTTDGLPGNMVNAVFEDKSGGMWIGTDDGLARFKDGKFRTITLPNGDSISNVNGISQDREGNIWINSGIGDKVLQYQEGSSKVEIVRNDLFDNKGVSFLEDKAGNIWFGTSSDGLHRIEQNGRRTIFHKQDGLADEYVNVLYRDRNENLWIGTRNGLNLFKDGVLTKFTEQDGFTGKHILSFHEDRNGNLWIGTHGDGLFRFREGKFAGFTSKSGLYDNLAFQILEDDNGNLWMSGNKGIYRANIAELEDFSAGRRTSVNSFSYGSFDGMLSRECNGANPAGARAKDGRLWFPTIKGVVVIDPKATDKKQPVVSIEKVLIDNQALPNSAQIEINPSQSDLELQFTALSWNRPTQIKFKYQLVGLDADWVDAGTRRTAYYPHIAPGEYTFRVIADNGEGIWNLEGKSLSVKVLPPFYQTWWFYLLCALLILLVIRLIYLYRISQLRKIHEAHEAFTQKLFESQEAFSRQLIESQESERKRIAIELHDSIGQNLIVIRNRALMGLNSPEKQDRLIAQMEEISESAADSITEVRRISQNLHPYQIEHLGLTTAIETMIENADESSPTEFEKEIDDIDEILSKESEINLYRIIQESINNILKHSEAKKAKIGIKKSNEFLNVVIEDDGKGFNKENLSLTNGGLGLTGIRERAKMLDAKHEILSIEGKGTSVSLQINLPQINE